MGDVGQGGGEHGQVSRVTQNLHKTCNEVGIYIEAYGTKSNFLPKTLTFFPVFFCPRGHRQLRPGRGDGEAGVYYFLLLYLVQYTYFYLLTIKHKYKFIN